MEQSIETMAGIVFLVFGLSYFLNAYDWINWLNSIRNGGRQYSLAIGAMHILLGSFVVAFHWVWSGWAPMILTVMGIWAIAEGVVYLLFPEFLAKFMGWMAPYYKPVLRGFGVAVIVLSFALLYPIYNNEL